MKMTHSGNKRAGLIGLIVAIAIALGVWLYVIHTPVLEPSVAFQSYVPTRFPDSSPVTSIQASILALRSSHPVWYKQDVVQLVLQATVKNKAGDSLALKEQRWKTPTLICESGLLEKTNGGIRYCLSTDHRWIRLALHTTLILISNLDPRATPAEINQYINTFAPLKDVPVRIVSDPTKL